jgi:hypothetical protein
MSRKGSGVSIRGYSRDLRCNRKIFRTWTGPVRIPELRMHPFKASVNLSKLAVANTLLSAIAVPICQRISPVLTIKSWFENKYGALWACKVNDRNIHE